MVAGDLIFVRGRSFFSPFIRHFDPGPFTHVAFALDDFHVIDAQRFRRVEVNHLNFKDYEIVPMDLTSSEQTVIYCKALRYIGTEYDYKRILGLMLDNGWNNPNNLICTEFIGEVLEKGEYKGLKPNELYRKVKEG